MTPRELAEAAKRWMEDPMTKRILMDTREIIVRKLESLDAPDRENEHELRLTLQVIKKLPQRIPEYLNEFKMEEHKADQAKKLEARRETLTKVNKVGQ